MFVHRTGERNNDSNLVLRYESCAHRPPNIAWDGTAMVVTTRLGGDGYRRQSKREVAQCEPHEYIAVVTRQRSSIDGDPIRYVWTGPPPYYDLATIPERVLDDLEFSWKYCKLAC